MICDTCKNEMKPFVYGFPTSELFDLADKGEVILGGCSVFEYAPTHYCETCQEQYPKADEVEYEGY